MIMHIIPVTYVSKPHPCRTNNYSCTHTLVLHMSSLYCIYTPTHNFMFTIKHGIQAMFVGVPMQRMCGHPNNNCEATCVTYVRAPVHCMSRHLRNICEGSYALYVKALAQHMRGHLRSICEGACATYVRAPVQHM